MAATSLIAEADAAATLAREPGIAAFANDCPSVTKNSRTT